MADYYYFDYAAATPIDKRVLSAMQPYFFEKFYNPSATYLPAKKVAAAIADARGRVARILGARPSEIIFTAGGTEANNLAIRGVMGQYPKANIVTSAVEHESILHPAHLYAHKLAPVTAEGLVNLPKLRELIDENTVLVSVMYANNEVGAIQPLREIARAIEDIRQKRKKTGNSLPLLFHTDACQAAAYLDLHVHRLGVDMMTLNGGKIYGPKQSGVLFVKTGLFLKPQVLGGGQEYGRRSGTENVAGIVGFSKALELAQGSRSSETHRLQKLQSQFISSLKKQIPSAIINGTLKSRLPNNVHITIPGYDNERLLLLLEQQKVLCAAGSACSASNEEPSHVLKAMGVTDEDARASLRFSMGNGTKETDIKKAVQALANCL